MQTRNTTRQRQTSRLSPFDEPATWAACCGVPIRTYGYTHILAGAPFYRLQHPAKLMVLVAVLIAHGCPLQANVTTFDLDEPTVIDWQARDGR